MTLKPARDWFENLPTHRLMVEMSLWSADLADLGHDIKRVEQGTDMFHIDVSDGHFTPALLFFPDQVARLRKFTAKPFHIHLMVKDEVLESQTEQFIEAGADLISVHAENTNAIKVLEVIRKKSLKAGIVLKLESEVHIAEKYLPHIDMLTLLGTRIGVKGQSLADEAPSRLTQARQMVKSQSHRIVVAADGGIRENTVPKLRNGGAETIVMGSLAFGAQNFDERIAWVHAQQ